MSATLTPSPTAAAKSSKQRYREMVIAAAKGESYIIAEAQTLLWQLGKSRNDFDRDVDTVRRRLEAIETQKHADDERAAINALNARREAVRAECIAKRADLEKQLAAVGEPLIEFDRQNPIPDWREVHRRRSNAVEVLERTADPAIDAKIAAKQERQQEIGRRREEIGTITRKEDEILRRLEKNASIVRNGSPLMPRQEATATARVESAQHELAEIEAARTELVELATEDGQISKDIRELESSKLDWRNFGIE